MNSCPNDIIFYVSSFLTFWDIPALKCLNHHYNDNIILNNPISCIININIYVANPKLEIIEDIVDSIDINNLKFPVIGPKLYKPVKIQFTLISPRIIVDQNHFILIGPTYKGNIRRVINQIQTSLNT
jgi:hypothetical protein